LVQVAKEEGARKSGKEWSDIEDDLRLLASFSKIIFVQSVSMAREDRPESGVA